MNSNDELMWLLADEGETSAIESFSRRHPEHHAELMRRINMVREIKGTRPQTPSTEIPAFTPKTVYEPRRAPKWVAVAAGAAILAGAAFAGYSSIKTFARPNTSDSSPTHASTTPPGNLNPSMPGNVQPKVVPEGFDPNQNLVPQQPPAKILAAWQKPVDLHFKSISLVELFNEITRQTGLKVEIGPGLLPTDVPVELSGVSAIAALKGLGEMYGFTVFEQDEHSVLVIPAVDPTEYPTEAPHEDSRENTPPVRVEGGPESRPVEPGPGELPAVTEDR